MFYESSRNDHGLIVDPFKALVVPRPIGWITTIDGHGRVNLAPFSFFNGIAEDPQMVAFAPGGRKADRPIKDSRANVEIVAGERETGTQLVQGLHDLQPLHGRGRQLAIGRQGQIGVSAQLGAADPPAQLIELGEAEHLRAVNDHRIGSGNIEARFDDIGGEQQIVLLVVEGARPIARLGYSEYVVVDSKFSMRRPG